MKPQQTKEELLKMFDSYIKIAADDITKLRMIDVDRVMEQAQNVEELCLLSEFIIEQRKDFDVAEVIEIEAEIMLERRWKAQPCRRKY